MADKIEVGEIHEWFGQIYLTLPDNNCISLGDISECMGTYNPGGMCNPIGIEGYLDHLEKKYKDRRTTYKWPNSVDYSKIKRGQLFCINDVGKDTHIFVKLQGTACARFLTRHSGFHLYSSLDGPYYVVNEVTILNMHRPHSEVSAKTESPESRQPEFPLKTKVVDAKIVHPKPPAKWWRTLVRFPV